MGVVLKRVTADTSAPPSAYGAAGIEPPVPGTPQWSERAHVAIVGGGLTGLWTAHDLATKGARVAVLEARQIGNGASGRAFGQLVPFLKHSHQKIVADFGGTRGERLSQAVAAAPAEISAFLEEHQIACAAVRSGILFGAKNDAGQRSLEQTTRALNASGALARMLYGAEAAAIIGSDFYKAVFLDPRGFHLDPLAYARGLARVAAAQGASLYPETRADRIVRQGRVWEVHCGARRIVADRVVIATNAYSGELWPALARSMVPFLVHGAITEPLDDAALARILPQGQPLTDTRRLYSGVRKLGRRLHVSIDGASFMPRATDAQAGVRARLAELYPWLPTPRVAEHWSGWIALTTDQYPRLHRLADGVFAAIGCNGRGLAASCILGRDLAHLARDGDEGATTFPVTPLRPLPVHDAAAAVVAATVSAKRLLDRMDAPR
jgi:glycine/D-amino acid oxidase-like deaminating enzyme